MLERTGCTIEIVNNGHRAVERVCEEMFDVVLMDCQMPEFDGYEAAREIRRQEALRRAPRRLPIVAITAHAMQGDREKCLQAGMDDYITKPLQMGDLLRVLTRWVKAAHRLKGSSSNLALERIRLAALTLETHVREKGLSGVEACAHALRADFAALVMALEPMALAVPAPLVAHEFCRR